MTPGLGAQTELEIGNSPAPVDCVGGLAEMAGAHSVTTVAAWLANSQHLPIVSLSFKTRTVKARLMITMSMCTNI